MALDRVLQSEQYRGSSANRALGAREEDYSNRLRRLLEERADQEQRDIASILNELARAIEAELDDA